MTLFIFLSHLIPFPVCPIRFFLALDLLYIHNQQMTVCDLDPCSPTFLHFPTRDTTSYLQSVPRRSFHVRAEGRSDRSLQRCGAYGQISTSNTSQIWADRMLEEKNTSHDTPLKVVLVCWMVFVNIYGKVNDAQKWNVVIPHFIENRTNNIVFGNTVYAHFGFGASNTFKKKKKFGQERV